MGIHRHRQRFDLRVAEKVRGRPRGDHQLVILKVTNVGFHNLLFSINSAYRCHAKEEILMIPENLS